MSGRGSTGAADEIDDMAGRGMRNGQKKNKTEKKNKKKNP